MAAFISHLLHHTTLVENKLLLLLRKNEIQGGSWLDNEHKALLQWL